MAKSITKTFSLIILAMLIGSSTLMASDAMDMIKKSNEMVQAILKQPESNARHKKLNTAMNEFTSFKVMAEKVTSKFCNSLTKQQCDEFNNKFQELLRTSSAKKMEKYRADKIEYISESVKGKNATVRTMVTYKNEKMKMDYELEKINGKWLIVNYIFEDVNALENYSKQFKKLFKTKSFDEVMKKISEKTQKGDL